MAETVSEARRRFLEAWEKMFGVSGNTISFAPPPGSSSTSVQSTSTVVNATNQSSNALNSVMSMGGMALNAYGATSQASASRNAGRPTPEQLDERLAAVRGNLREIQSRIEYRTATAQERNLYDQLMAEQNRLLSEANSASLTNQERSLIDRISGIDNQINGLDRTNPNYETNRATYEAQKTQAQNDLNFLRESTSSRLKLAEVQQRIAELQKNNQDRAEGQAKGTEDRQLKQLQDEENRIKQQIERQSQSKPSLWQRLWGNFESRDSLANNAFGNLRDNYAGVYNESYTKYFENSLYAGADSVTAQKNAAKFAEYDVAMARAQDQQALRINGGGLFKGALALGGSIFGSFASIRSLRDNVTFGGVLGAVTSFGGLLLGLRQIASSNIANAMMGFAAGHGGFLGGMSGFFGKAIHFMTQNPWGIAAVVTAIVLMALFGGKKKSVQEEEMEKFNDLTVWTNKTVLALTAATGLTMMGMNLDQIALQGENGITISTTQLTRALNNRIATADGQAYGEKQLPYDTPIVVKGTGDNGDKVIILSKYSGTQDKVQVYDLGKGVKFAMPTRKDGAYVNFFDSKGKVNMQAINALKVQRALVQANPDLSGKALQAAVAQAMAQGKVNVKSE